MRQLRILMILVEPPLPFGNAASRWFHVLLKGLKKRQHHVDVVVASGIDGDIKKAKELFKDDPHFFIFPFGARQGLASKIMTVIAPHSYQFFGPAQKKIQELDPQTYDIVHVEQTWGGWTSFEWRHKTLVNVHHLQTIDLEFVRHSHFKNWLMYKSWFWAEKNILRRYPFVRTCSPRLEPYIKSWGNKKLVQTVPVSLDLRLYPMISSELRQSKNPIITLIGNMTWYPSISAARRLLNDLWPSIQAQVPQAKLRIVGWSARSALAEHLEKPGVEILENVPDIQPYFNEASVMVYPPSRGSGMKIKILEALAFGVPVVTTSEGAEGLPAIDMVHMGIAEDNSGLIDRTVKILNDFQLQESLRFSGRELVASHCGEDTTVEQIIDIYKKMLTF